MSVSFDESEGPFRFKGSEEALSTCLSRKEWQNGNNTGGSINGLTFGGPSSETPQ